MKDKKSLRDNFTPEELEALRKYIEDVKTWKAEEPARLSDDDKIYILRYAQENNGAIPEIYKGRAVIEYETDIILSEEDEITEDTAAKIAQSLDASFYHPIVSEPIYNKWYAHIFDIAPTETIFKLLRLINSDQNQDKEIDFLYDPEDDNSTKKIEDTIKELLSEDLTREEAHAVTSVFVTFPEKSSQLLITHKDYQYALLPYKNNKAYIVDFDKQLKFTFDAAGDPTIDLRTPEDFEAYKNTLDKDNIAANIADTDLLATLGAAVQSSYCSNYGDRITVYFPNFARALGVQIDGADSKNNHFDIWDKIKQLENIGGVLVEDKSILRAFVMLGYNKEENTLTFASPYLYRLMDILKKNPASVSKIKRDNKPLWEIVGTSFLIDNQIIKARNKITSQLIKNIIAGLYQYGTKTEAARNPGKTYKDKNLVCYKISFRSLIDRTPLLNEALRESKPTGTTRILTRSFLGNNYIKTGKSIIEEYMREYTHAFEYWKDLQIEIPTPSLKSLGDQLIISHHGINGDFKNDLYLPKAEKNELDK